MVYFVWDPSPALPYEQGRELQAAGFNLFLDNKSGVCRYQQFYRIPQRGKILIVQDFAKEKSAARTAGCESQTGFAAQYLQVIFIVSPFP